MPKRYFDIPESRLTLELEMTTKGMSMTIEEIEKQLDIQGLKEVDCQTYNTLTKAYTGR